MNIKHSQRWMFAAIAGLSVFAAGCQSKGSTGPAGAMPLPAVSVITVSPETAPIYHDYAAQTFARDMVEVRGRVEGYVEKRLFQVGSEVKAGQLLYVLDLRPYEAAVEKASGDLTQSKANHEFTQRQVALIQAEADLAQARANLLKAEQDVKRLKPLVQEDAAAQQDLDNAMAALQANQANVKAREANVEQIRLSTKAQLDTAGGQVDSNNAMLRTAQLNLEYATIRAPISGRIGDSIVQVGGLVSPNAPQPLTTIVPLDPIWIRFKVSEAQYLEFEKRRAQSLTRNVPLELVLADGTVHPHEGRVQNTVNQVDPKTGTLELQATFPNPKRTILPGQFGHVRMRVEEKKDALLVPQRSVTELQGLQSVMTVGPDGKVQARGIVTGERVGDRWVIVQGLKPGDNVIVEGLQKARPGAPVKAEPYKSQPADEGKRR